MTQSYSRKSQRHAAEDAAARMQRSIERDERRRLEKRRAAMLAAGLALAGVVLLGGGMAALGRAAAPAATAEAPRTAEVTLAQEPSPAPTVSALPNEESAVSIPATPATAAAPAATKVATPQSKTRVAVRKATPAAKAPQRLSLRIGTVGYEPSVLSASSNSPVLLSVGRGEGCAAGFLMPSLGISRDNSRGRITIRLGKLNPGTYRFTCGMGMVEGRLVVR